MNRSVVCTGQTCRCSLVQTIYQRRINCRREQKQHVSTDADGLVQFRKAIYPEGLHINFLMFIHTCTCSFLTFVFTACARASPSVRLCSTRSCSTRSRRSLPSHTYNSDLIHKNLTMILSFTERGCECPATQRLRHARRLRSSIAVFLPCPALPRARAPHHSIPAAM